ncbi:hypothetical protein EYF80_031131 [Liparis tanakae]|uniref:Uncharacterized protein n=1 Tax=Liparis tanakae TaxID=230148 RepID=A0A4Z2GYE1_9TELE|nr:hypothetical protein EYF80_031131 [Liparis tanakae]
MLSVCVREERRCTYVWKLIHQPEISSRPPTLQLSAGKQPATLHRGLLGPLQHLSGDLIVGIESDLEVLCLMATKRVKPIKQQSLT